MTNTPEDYQWSGHNVYLGKAKCDWLSTDWILQRFDRKKSDARKAYRRFVMSGLDKGYRQEFHSGNQGGVALGDEEFVVRIPEYGKSKPLRNERIRNVSEIIKLVCNFYQI